MPAAAGNRYLVLIGTEKWLRKWPVGPRPYEEATHRIRPTDPTDPGNAADLSISMGFCVGGNQCGPAETIRVRTQSDAPVESQQ